MLYSWISFWLTYFIFGTYLYHDNVKILQNHSVHIKDLLNTIGLNSILTFLFIPIANMIPTLIYVSNTFYGYCIRIILSIIIGDFIFYIMHRILHFKCFYHWHKKHHLFVNTNGLAGLYCSPIEMIFSNHLSMIIPLKIISCYSRNMLMLESAVVAFNIIKSHNGNGLFGSKFHQLHHEKNYYNYGFSYIFDILFGTSCFD